MFSKNQIVVATNSYFTVRKEYFYTVVSSDEKETSVYAGGGIAKAPSNFFKKFEPPNFLNKECVVRNDINNLIRGKKYRIIGIEISENIFYKITDGSQKFLVPIDLINII